MATTGTRLSRKVGRGWADPEESERKGNMEEDKETKLEETKSDVVDKKTESYLRHNRVVVVLLVILAVVVFAGGFFVLGRISGKRITNFGRFGMMQNIAFERSNMPRMMVSGFGHHMFSGGITGKITNINGDNLTIRNDAANRDYTVAIFDNTSIYNSSGDIASKADLKLDQQVVVSGSSNSNGQIQARVIRIK